MRWDIENIVGGMASVQLFAPRQSYEYVLNCVNQRADEEAVPSEQALIRFMRERFLGQMLMTGASLGLMGLAVVGAARGWPDAVVLLAGCGPAVLACSVALAQSNHAKRHKPGA